MTPAPALVTPTDRALLHALEVEPTVVAACRRAGITRDTGVYRLRRLAQATGGPIVQSDRGGRFGGGSRLTPRGRALLRGALDAVAVAQGPEARAGAALPLRGIYRSNPEPNVVLDGEIPVVVAFRARDGEMVWVGIDPESVVVAPRAFASSARNRLDGRVATIRRTGSQTRSVAVAVGPHRIAAAVTERSVRSLGLAPGRAVVLLVKATAVRRLPAPSG